MSLSSSSNDEKPTTSVVTTTTTTITTTATTITTTATTITKAGTITTAATMTKSSTLLSSSSAPSSSLSSSLSTVASASATPKPPTTPVITAVPITVQTAQNSPAFINMSVGQLLQKQRRFAVVTMPPPRKIPAPSVTETSVHPFQVKQHVPQRPLTAPRPIKLSTEAAAAATALGAHGGAGTELIKPVHLSTAQKSSIMEVDKTVVTTKQPPEEPADEKQRPILEPSKLDDLVRQIDPTSVLEEPVKTMLTEFVDDFVDQVIERSCRLAHHRGSDTLDVRDVEFVLQRYFNCPVFRKRDTEEQSKSAGGSVAPENTPEMMAHKQRMAMIKKTLKKP